MKMHKFILLIIPLFFNCKSYQKQIQGKFVEKKSKIKEIIISGHSYLLIGDNRDEVFTRDYVCCDTLSYGAAILDKKNGFLELSSSDKFRSNLDFSVEEKVNKNITGSLKINISTPLDSISPYTEVLSSGITTDKKNDFLKFNLLINSTYTFFISQDNPTSIIINKEDIGDEYISELQIIVSINECRYLPISNKGIEEAVLLPYPYLLKNKDASELNISIPDLNYKYLNFKRLNKDYIKIKDESTLIWNDEEYVKGLR